MKSKLLLSAVVILLLLTASQAVAQGSIGFTHVPAWASSENLKGRVWNVNPPDYKVADYLYVEGGWWTKPYYDYPLTPIQSDSTWECDVTTGGIDGYATRYASYLLPNGVYPQRRLGQSTLPESLAQYPHVFVCRQPGNRKINFSGYDWVVKQCEWPLGPGPNYFSDQAGDVWVDTQGKLHMKITYRNGRWYSSEVVCDTSFGYGKYVFYLESRVDTLDPNMVLGLFTWDEYGWNENYREIDIEFSRWGIIGSDTNAQYVIQPWTDQGNIHRFGMDLNNIYSTHLFYWHPDTIIFQSLRGHSSFPVDPDSIIESWIYRGNDDPIPGKENPRINFWLLNGFAPINNQDAEIVVKKFEYVSPTGIRLPRDDSFVQRVTSLVKNYPNPVRDKTTIEFNLPKPSIVSVRIYNTVGQLVRTYTYHGETGTQTIIWDSNDHYGWRVSAGIYFYQISFDSFNITRKMVVIE